MHRTDKMWPDYGFKNTKKKLEIQINFSMAKFKSILAAATDDEKRLWMAKHAQGWNGHCYF